MAKGEVPKITWGAAFANTLTFGWPLDNPMAYSDVDPSASFADVPSNGERDAWVAAHFQMLQGRLRWIPTADATVPVVQTGWDGATGVRAALEWMREGNVLRFYPDKDVGSYLTCYLIEPMTGPPSMEPDGTRVVQLVIRSDDGTAFTGY